MSNILTILIIILGGGATVAGILWDLARGHRDYLRYRSAEREAARMNPTHKLDR